MKSHWAFLSLAMMEGEPGTLDVGLSSPKGSLGLEIIQQTLSEAGGYD